MIETFILPHAEAYRSIKHSRAISGTLARVIEEYDRFEGEKNQKPNHEDQELIHEQVAKELNPLDG